MKCNNSSWFPLRNFCKGDCHFDWMLGASQYKNLKDSLTGSIVKMFETVLWNRTLKANITLESYNNAVKSNDPVMLDKLKSFGLPLDIKV